MVASRELEAEEDDEGLPPAERERRANIRRNRERMRQLGLAGAGESRCCASCWGAVVAFLLCFHRKLVPPHEAAGLTAPPA